MKGTISIALTILSLLLVLGLLRLWPPASPAGGPLPALPAEQKDISMQSDAKELVLAVVKHFLGFEAR